MKRIGIVAAIVLVMASFASCGASSPSQNAEGGMAAPAAVADKGGGGGTDGSSLYSPAIPNDDSFAQSDSFTGSETSDVNTAGEAPMAPAPAPAAGNDVLMGEGEAGPGSGAPADVTAESGAAQAAGNGMTEAQIAADSGRKITFSASYTINTKQYDKDYAAIGRIAAQAGGYIANENSSASSYEGGGNTGRNAYFSLRVPADKFESVLDGINGVGTVVNKSRSSQDLTSQYFDTESRITLLEMRRDRILGYLKDATDSKQIVAFERELTNTLYELDTYQGDKRQMDRLVALSTIDVSLYELITPETIGADGQPLGERASNAFALSSAGVGSFLRNSAVFAAAAAPVVLLLAVIAAIVFAVVWLIRRLSAKRLRAPKRAPERNESSGTQQ